MATRSKFDGWSHRGIGDVERAVAEYLADEARHGSILVKTTRVADDLDIKPIRAGQAIATLREESATLSIERWSGEQTSPTVWQVEHDGPSPFGVECPTCDQLIDETADECPHCGRRLSR